jgi:hypothetical protein
MPPRIHYEKNSNLIPLFSVNLRATQIADSKTRFPASVLTGNGMKFSIDIKNNCMNMTNSKIKKSLTPKLNFTDGVLPFTEKPSNTYLEQKEETGKNDIQASDLFSYFTADIIKEEVIFTR